CQIDHITNWSDGGTTDLDNLGPTCQFHNRDRYRNPAHYRLHRTGKDRWGFTYIGSRTRTRQ
ncbi:HNH endonuclease signature motif containing protein, partial [Microtetraspora malaysiensis]